jgi:PBP1b-binding outer membrane lipoprotein LpoB
MKRIITPILAGCLAVMLLTGCSWQIGGGAKNATMQPTIGQQLIDLQKAKDAGIITDSEYQAQKSKILAVKITVPPGS